jgi:iron(III) transport system ATP-binding protein
VNQILEIKELSRHFPGTETPAVEDLNLILEEGTITALVGESGCGKSTTLRMIAGFEIPDQGSIDLKGRRISGSNRKDWLPPESRSIGMVFQDHALFPHLKVEANIGFGLKAGGRTEEGRKRIHELLELTGLAGLEKRFPHELSGGQQQRVAIARAMATKPDLLLMDEAFNNLDIRLKQRLLPEVRMMLKDAGITTLLVTHDRYEAFELSDRIVVMRNGRSIQDGTPKEIYESPNESYIADFFGETNFIDIDKDRYAIRPENIWITEGKKEEKDFTDERMEVKGQIHNLRYRGQFHELFVIVRDSSSPLDGKMLLAHAHNSPKYNLNQSVRIHISDTSLIPLSK